MAKAKKDKKRAGEEQPVVTDATTEGIAQDLEVPQVAGVATNVSDQVTQAWTGLLAMATQQGASRRDIVVMTLLTAGSVLDITAVNLWPLGSDLPLDEASGFGHYQAALGALQIALRALNNPVDFQSIPGVNPGQGSLQFPGPEYGGEDVPETDE